MAKPVEKNQKTDVSLKNKRIMWSLGGLLAACAPLSKIPSLEKLIPYLFLIIMTIFIWFSIRVVSGNNYTKKMLYTTRVVSIVYGLIAIIFFIFSFPCTLNFSESSISDIQFVTFFFAFQAFCSQWVHRKINKSVFQNDLLEKITNTWKFYQWVMLVFLIAGVLSQGKLTALDSGIITGSFYSLMILTQARDLYFIQIKDSQTETDKNLQKAEELPNIYFSKHINKIS